MLPRQAVLMLLVLLALLVLMALMALLALLALFAETASHRGGNYSGTDTHIRLTGSLSSVDGRIGGL